MKETEPAGPARRLVFECELEAPPEKVWRAISIPAFREKWLPGKDLPTTEPVFSQPGEEIRYRMRDGEPPFLESVVTFRIGPGPGGGTVLRILHEIADARAAGRTPANGNSPPRMLAA